MLRALALAVSLLLCVAAPARAGAWARAPGEVFLSFSSNIQSSVEALAQGIDATSRYTSAYLELGLGRRLTFSADLGGDQYVREAMGILRYTLTNPDARLQVAVDLGLGRRSVEVLGESDLLRAGISLGYGFGMTPPDWMPMDLQGGWIALDAMAVRDMTREEDRWKVEATFGLTLSDRSRFLLQLVAEEWPGLEISYGINPSFVYRIHGETFVELGVRAVQGGDTQLGLELGLWHQF